MLEKLRSLFTSGKGKINSASRSMPRDTLRFSEGASRRRAPTVPDPQKWAAETPAARNELAWCYAELDRLSSVCETQELLIAEQLEKIDEQEREIARGAIAMRAYARAMQQLEQSLGPKHHVTKLIAEAIKEGLEL